MNNKYILLATNIKERAANPKWRNPNVAIAEGEILSLLGQYGLSGSEASINGIIQVLKSVYSDQELYYVNEEPASNSSGAKLGNLLKARVSSLEDSDSKAEQILKSWIKSDPYMFLNKGIRRELVYNARTNSPIRIPLDEILKLILDWERNQAKFVRSISAEYYYRRQQ